MRLNSKIEIYRLAATCAVSLLASQANAEAPTASASGSAHVEEVVVTATRQLQNMQDIPIAVTALTGTRLDEKQVVDVIGLGNVVPGMQVKQALNPLSLTASIRGVTQFNATVNVDPPIGVYVDGVYNVLNAGSNNAMIDMERVEVLKGPQGTLFGRNTIGGTINIHTTEPTDTFGGYVQGDAGNYGAFGGTGVVNVPIKAGVLDTRFVYQHTQHDGYGRNVTTGHDTATLDQDYFRGSALLTLSDNWSALTSASYTYSRGYAAGFKLGYFASSFNASYPTASGHPGDQMQNYVDAGSYQDSFGDQDATYSMRQYTATETVTGELSDAVTVKSIAGYIHTDIKQSQDFDGSPYPFLNIASLPIQAHQFSEELQLFGDALDDRLNWITGLYYFVVGANQYSTALALTNLAPAVARASSTAGPNVSNQSYSAFAQATYELAPQVHLTAGARYVVDDREIAYKDHQDRLSTGNFATCLLANDPLAPTASNCQYSDSVKYHFVPWTVGIDYKPDSDTLLYAKISQGYRSGAFPLSGPAAASAQLAAANPAGAAATNAAALATFAPAAPEKLWSPEIGVKLDLLDRKLRLNGALYYSDYQNIQVNVNLPPACPTCTPISALQNSGAAHIYGGELEAVALLGELQLDLSLGYTYPKYQSGSAYYGQPVINVSKFTSALTASYPVETSSGRLTMAATYSYRSEQVFYTPTIDSIENDAVSQPGYGLLSGRVAYELKGAPVTFAFYGQNLTNKEYKVAASAFPAPLSFSDYVVGSPRTFGGSVKYSF